MRRLLLSILLLFLYASCFNEPDCIVTATTSIKIDFKKTTINKTTLLKSVTDSTVIFSSVSVAGIDTEYIKAKNLSSLTLPINPQATSMKYILNTQSANGAITAQYYLEFSFGSESRVVSQKCGAYTYFLNLQVIDTNLETTKYKLTNSRLLKNTTNVQVFF